LQSKLSPIDFDLIVGLPSIRKLELIKHLPSLFLNENKPSIGDFGEPFVLDPKEPSAGVVKPPILASYAEGGMSNKSIEVVVA